MLHSRYTASMYETIQALILGVIQGVTEFIPVSSAAHLIIAEKLLQFGISGLAFDVMLHFGTLLALLVYFRRDLWEFARSITKGGRSWWLLWYVLVATVPAAVIGFFAYDLVAVVFRSLWIVVVMLVLVALVMFIADRQRGSRELSSVKLKDAVIIGFAQALALIPGTSRSGSTIVAGSLLGFNNAEAARFSFYMAIPILLGANLRVLGEPGVAESALSQWHVYAAGLAVAFVSGYAVIAFLLRYLSTHKLILFAWYRIVLALILIVILVV